MNSESGITETLPVAASTGGLADLFLRHGGNLSDKWEQYLGVYESELSRFARAGRAVHLLEIGVQNGGSLQIWRDYLPEESEIVGVDIDPDCAELDLGDAIKVFVADAGDAAELAGVLGDRVFDIVIDDGSHRSTDVVATFRTCFQRVAPGGLYLIEDLHCSYLSTFGGGYRAPGATMEWLKSVADALNADHFEGPDLAAMGSDLQRELREIGRQTARISFFDSVAVLQKLSIEKRAPYRRVMTGRQAPLTPASQIMQLMPPPQLRSLILSPPASSMFAKPLVDALADAKEQVGAMRAAVASAEERERIVAASTVTAAATARADAERLQASIERGLAEAREQRGESVQMLRVAEDTQARLADLLAAAREEAADLRRNWLRSDRLLRSTEDQVNALRLQVAAAEAREQAERCREADARREVAASAERAEAAERAEQSAHAAAAAQAARAAIAEARTTVVEAEVLTIQSSTSWHLTRPLRAAVGLFPPSTRMSGRRALKAFWRLAHGRMPYQGRLRPAHGSEQPHPAGIAPPDESGGVEPLRSELRAGHERPGIMDEAAAESGGGHAADPAAVSGAADPVAAYDAWFKAHKPHADHLSFQRRFAAGFALQPLFSILVPVYRTPPDVFCDMLRSVTSQSYGRWDLCLVVVDTGPDDAPLLLAAAGAAQMDPRIQLQVLQGNHGIAGNSDIGLDMAQGDWIVLLDHDDTLRADALFQIARAVNADPEVDFIYSDKDMIDRSGRRHYAPLFKSGWSPETMLNANYLTHVCAMRTARVRELGGWDSETDGAQDWDLFLRVIGRGGRVAHIPHVLYHWRHIETSVAAAGFDAKPFAAAGQLRALTKHLPAAGWPQARPYFEGPYLRMEWGCDLGCCVSVVIYGDTVAPVQRSAAIPGLVVEVLTACGSDIAHEVDLAIHRAHGTLIVMLDAGYRPEADDWVAELALPLSNPAIGAVAGRTSDRHGNILDYGVYLQDGLAYPAFRGEPVHYSGPAGGGGWYRNFAAASGGSLAFRRTDWQEVGGFSALSAQGRPDVAFTMELRRRGLGRIMVNPFARFQAMDGPGSFERTTPTLSNHAILETHPEGDPYLNPHLDAAVTCGAPRIRLPAPPAGLPASGHDYSAEARYVAGAYDATAADIAASVAACSAPRAGSMGRVIWLLPDFKVAFYGGIFTILRMAEHMRVRHGISPCFAVMTDQTTPTVTRIIAQALPALAQCAQVVTFLSPAALPDLGEADAAICTLWITAYPLLNLRGIARKFYFMQDWEPSFYPGGTISAMVEATYRFGFHAVCNTPSLAESYAALGGRADHFLPAVDGQVFHGRVRPARERDGPFILVCYARPSAPRNCFEVMSHGLRELKRRYADGIQILSAGAEWDPASWGLQGVVDNLGLLPYAETGALYRAADAGFVAMATRHPSYLPLELMACGAAVVTNRNPFTSWLLRDGENTLLCEMTRGDIAATVGRLIDDPALRHRLAAQAMDDVERGYGDWTAACERVYQILVHA